MGIAWLPCYLYWVSGGVWLTHLPPQPVDVVGVIKTLGQYAQPGFELKVLSIDGVTLPGWQDVTVRCHWHDSPPLAQGQRWRLRMQLRPVYSTANPGAFNYQLWMLSRNVLLKARIREGAQIFLPGGSPPTTFYQRWFDRWHRLTEPLHYAGVVRALTFGVRRDLSPQDREQFVELGIAHLLAISGLHIGLLATLGLMLGRLCATLPYWKKIPLYHEPAAVALALLLALGYAWLAGFSTSTCRALVMVMLFFAGRLCARRYTVCQLLVITIGVLLLLNPLQIFAAGFWLSVAAVAVIALVCWRCQSWWLRGSRWQRRLKLALALQLGLMVLMLPMQWFWFGGISLVAPLANLIAIPYVSLLVVPLCLLALLSSFAPPLAAVLLTMVDWLLAILMRLLQPLTVLSLSYWSVPVTQVAAVLLGALALLVWWLPVSRSLRVPLAVACLLALCGYWLPDSQPRWRIRVLDVGQGLSVVVEQGREALVYDTGARYPSGFNYADSVVTPVLRHDGISRLDSLILSHQDNDHAGGWRELWRHWSPPRLISGGPLPVAHQRCQAGQPRRWGMLSVRTVSPPPGLPPGQSSNNGSCVVWVGDDTFSMLLTGDIEWPRESGLVAEQPRRALAASLLVSPHHGSKTSSTTGLIAAVAPQLVIHSAGYRNPYRFPHPTVVARYASLGVPQLITADSGAITIEVFTHHWQLSRYRHAPWSVWYQQLPESLR